MFGKLVGLAILAAIITLPPMGPQAQTAHYVALRFNTSVAPPVPKAYRMFRSTAGATGPWTGVASGLQPGCATYNSFVDWTDKTVASGTKYWYQAKAVDPNTGRLSAPSNVVSTVVP